MNDGQHLLYQKGIFTPTSNKFLINTPTLSPSRGFAYNNGTDFVIFIHWLDKLEA